MKKKWLAICDEDEKYLGRLQEMLLENPAFPFEIGTFHSVEILKKELKKKEIALVLISEKWKTEDLGVEKSGKVVVLYLRKTAQKGTKEDNGIQKYQSVDTLRKQLLEKYEFFSGQVGEEVTALKEGKVIGVYTPIGRCLQTSFALLLGQLLAKEKKSVLYLNFEPYSGLSTILEREWQKDLTDLIYYMKGNKEKLMYKLQSMVFNINGLDYIAPAFSFMDLAAVTAEDWITLIQNLKKKSNYDYIILDLTEMVQGLLNVLRECMVVYTITRKDGFASAKMEQYERLLKEWEYEDVMDKTRKWELPVFKQLPAGIEQLPYSDLAIYIRKMMEESHDL